MQVSSANLYDHFQAQFALRPEKIALTDESGSTYRFADLERRSAQLACFLTTLGIASGERISAQVAKSPQALCLYLACLRAGFVFHPLNTGYKTQELNYLLNNAAPAAVICDDRDAAQMATLCDQNGIAHLFTLNADGSGSLSKQSAHSSAAFGVVERTADDMACLLYSSGTTGVPKGIMVSHGNLLSNGQSLISAWGFTESDVLLHTLPIFHVHGLFVALSCVFLSGASMQWLANFDTAAVLARLPLTTCMMGVPTYYVRLLNAAALNKVVCRHMRLFISGSAPLLSETFTEFESKTGHRILERYGMSETGMNTSNPLNGVRKPGTVGPPLPGVEVRVTDDAGCELPQGSIGNLQVRGANVFSGYWRLPEKTAEDFTADGFFNTGDKGLIDDDGYIAIVGRAKDMVISGGLNVYPKEVELVIDTLTGVQESAVIGVPHADFGEAVVAVIVPTPSAAVDEATLITALREQLSGFKVPKRIVSLPALPRNTMGKVQKNILREQFGHLFD